MEEGICLGDVHSNGLFFTILLAYNSAMSDPKSYHIHEISVLDNTTVLFRLH